MIRSIVQHQDRVVPPVLVLLVQLQHQLAKENLHNLSVGVRLRQAQVHIAIGVNSHQHGDARCELHYGHGVCSMLWPPLPSAVVRGIKPGLIHIQENRLLLGELEHLDGKTLPHDQVVLRIPKQRDVLNLGIAHI